MLIVNIYNLYVFQNEAIFDFYCYFFFLLLFFPILLLTNWFDYSILKASEGRKKLWCNDPHEGVRRDHVV